MDMQISTWESQFQTRKSLFSNIDRFVDIDYKSRSQFVNKTNQKYFVQMLYSSTFFRISHFTSRLITILRNMCCTNYTKYIVFLHCPYYYLFIALNESLSSKNFKLLSVKTRFHLCILYFQEPEFLHNTTPRKTKISFVQFRIPQHTSYLVKTQSETIMQVCIFLF